MWPFRKKLPPIADKRVWNDDWKIGDTAEVVPANDWHSSIHPWERLEVGARYVVTGFSDSLARGGQARHYFLRLKGIELAYSTQCFRKVRPVYSEESEVVQHILNVKPGKDTVREDA